MPFPGRDTKETAIAERLVTRFETGLAALAAGLSKPRAQKTLAAIQQRIGRLKEKSRGIGQHYEITVTPDETGTKAATTARKSGFAIPPDATPRRPRSPGAS